MSKKQKNVLIIVVDCLGADFIYDKKIFLPNIMKLMEGGYSFQNTIAATSTTSPNFASLLTALYPFESGLRSLSGSAIKNSVDTFPEILRLNGYSTYAEVTGPLVPELGLSKGFDEYNYRDNKTNIHTDWGEKLLTKFKHYKEPWFVLLHIWTLHSKNNSITQYTESLSKIDRYLGRLLMCLNENTIIVFTGDHGESVARSKFEYLTKRIGVRIVKMLRKDKVVTLRRFNPLGHGYSIYDVLVRIPLIFFKKYLVPVGTSRCQVRQIDLFPTIMDLIGIKYETQITGKSAKPIIEGKVNLHRDAYMEATGITLPNKKGWLAGIRIDNKFKFIYSPFRDDLEDELYNLHKDPEEKNNIALENEDLIKVLKNKIEEMKTEKFVGEKIDKETQKLILKRLKTLGYLD